MSANLYEGNKFYSLRVPAWHKQGFVNEGEPLDIDGVLDAMDANYTYELTDIYADMPDGSRYLVEEKKANLRIHANGTATFIGVVGNRFKNHYERELDRLVRILLDEFGISIETALYLGERGNRFALTFKLPYTITIGGKDVSESYLFASTAFDGTQATRLRNVLTRVVCGNTWSAAMREKGNRASIRHSSDLSNINVQQVREQMDLALGSAQEAEALANELAAITLRDEDIDQFLANLFPIPEGVDQWNYDNQTKGVKKSYTIGKEKRRKVSALLDADTNNMWAGTGWGLFNAVTEWADHEARSKDRAGMVMDGAADKVKGQALNLLGV